MFDIQAIKEYEFYDVDCNNLLTRLPIPVTVLVRNQTTTYHHQERQSPSPPILRADASAEESDLDSWDIALAC